MQVSPSRVMISGLPWRSCCVAKAPFDPFARRYLFSMLPMFLRSMRISPFDVLVN